MGESKRRKFLDPEYGKPRKAKLDELEKLFDAQLHSNTLVYQQLLQTFNVGKLELENPCVLVVPPLDVVPADFEYFFLKDATQDILGIWNARQHYHVPVVLCSIDIPRLMENKKFSKSFPDEYEFRLILIEKQKDG